MFESATHIVLRHYAHADYCGPMIGSKCCNSFAALYLRETALEAKGIEFGCHQIKRWDGRLNVERIRYDCEALGIRFAD